MGLVGLVMGSPFRVLDWFQGKAGVVGLGFRGREVEPIVMKGCWVDRKGNIGDLGI